MFALLENHSSHQKQGWSQPLSETRQKTRYAHNSLKQLKAQYQSLENQIKDLCSSINSLQKQVKNEDTSKQKILDKIKLLGVESSLNIAEQGALAGEDVESILQPIVAMLIEKRPTFPIDTHWLEEKVGAIRAHGFKRTLAQ